MCECLVEGVKSLFSFSGFQLAFPDSYAMPSHICEFLLVLNVPLSVSINLILPEVDVCFRQSEETASFVPVPKAAVDKYHRVVLAKHDVWMSGKSWVVEPEPVTSSEEESSDGQFRFGVLAAYSRHVVVPLAVG